MNLPLLLMLGTLWGSSCRFINVAVRKVPPLTLVAGRLPFLAFIRGLVMFVSRQAIPPE